MNAILGVAVVAVQRSVLPGYFEAGLNLGVDKFVLWVRAVTLITSFSPQQHLIKLPT